MYVHIYIYIHIYTYVHMYIPKHRQYISIYAHTHTHTHTHIHTHIYMHTYIYIEYVYIHTCILYNIYIYIYVYIYICTYIQVKGTTVVTSRQWQVMTSKRSYDQVMGVVRSTLFERQPSFFLFLHFKNMRGKSTLTIAGGIKQPPYKQSSQPRSLFFNFQFNTRQVQQGPKHTQP